MALWGTDGGYWPAKTEPSACIWEGGFAAPIRQAKRGVPCGSALQVTYDGDRESSSMRDKMSAKATVATAR